MRPNKSSWMPRLLVQCRTCFLPLYFFVLAFSSACSFNQPVAEQLPTQYDKWGCTIPPTVVALNKQGLNIEAISIMDVAVGKVDYRSTPELQVLLEKHSSNSMVAEYLSCGAIARGEVDKNNPEQVYHLKKFLHFMGTGPKPDEVSNWHRENPLPQSSQNRQGASSQERLVCVKQVEGGYELRDSIEKEYRKHRRDMSFDTVQDQLVGKWNQQWHIWVSVTEQMLSSVGGARAVGRFRTALITPFVRANESSKWTEIDNSLKGKIRGLEEICDRLS